MNFNYSYNIGDDNIIDFICNEEIDEFINAINQNTGYCMFTELIRDMAIKTKRTHGKQKLKATQELKETFRNMIKCFPPDLLEKHHLQLMAECKFTSEEHLRNRYPERRQKLLPKLPSNEEIEDLWKVKRKERKNFQEQIISCGSSLKKIGLNRDLVEIICKKLKK